MNSIPQRIRPKKTYPVGKVAREDLQLYLYNTLQMESWRLIVSSEFKDYDWTELMEKSEAWWEEESARRIQNSLDNPDDF